MSLARMLEIATDFVDAAGDDHPLVAELIAANDACCELLSGTTQDSLDWRSSAIAVHAAARARPQAPELTAHLALLIDLTDQLSQALDMAWKPSPALRRAAGLADDRTRSGAD